MIHKQAIFVLQCDPNLANWNSHAEKKITLHIQRTFAVFTNLLDEQHYVLKKQINQYRTQQYLKTVRLKALAKSYRFSDCMYLLDMRRLSSRQAQALFANSLIYVSAIYCAMHLQKLSPILFLLLSNDVAAKEFPNRISFTNVEKSL